MRKPRKLEKSRTRRTLTRLLRLPKALPAATIAVTLLSSLLITPHANADPSCANNDPKFGFCVGGKILEEYYGAGGFNFFGNATNTELMAASNGRWQPFEKNSSIYWHPIAGSHANQIGGSIRTKWALLGYENGALEYPTTRELGTPVKPGRYNHFMGGSLYWSSATGAHAVWGAIRNEWANTGWESGYLGFPASDELKCSDGVGTTSEGEYGGRGQLFEGGQLFWNTNQLFTPNSTSVNSARQMLVYSTSNYTSSFTHTLNQWNPMGKVTISQVPAQNGSTVSLSDVTIQGSGWAGIYAYGGPGNTTIQMNKSYLPVADSDYSKRVMAHEFGHALGFAHSCQTQIMNPLILGASTLTLGVIDKATYRAAWG